MHLQAIPVYYVFMAFWAIIHNKQVFFRQKQELEGYLYQWTGVKRMIIYKIFNNNAVVI